MISHITQTDRQTDRQADRRTTLLINTFQFLDMQTNILKTF